MSAMGIFTPGLYFAEDLRAQGSDRYRFVIASGPDLTIGAQDGSTIGVVDISPAGSWVETDCKNRGVPYHRLRSGTPDSAKAWICRNVLPRLLPTAVSFAA